MDNLLSALYAFPGGYLTDRLGYKRALAVFNIVAMLGYLIVIIWPVWPAVILGSVLFISWTALSLPASMSLVAGVLPNSKRTMGVTMHSLVRRIPMALGPIIGGLLIARYGEVNGVRMAFVLSLILGVVALIFQQVMIEDRPGTRRAHGNPLHLVKFMSHDLRILLVSDILVRFCEQIPYAFAVVWCMEVVGVSAPQFGILTAIEMATAVLVYIPVAYLADQFGKKPFIVITFFNFAMFPVVLFFSRSFEMLVIAFIVRGLKEFGEPTRKALIMDLAPEDKKAGMFGLYYLIRDVIVSIAAFGGAFLWLRSPALNFATATIFGLAGTLFFALFGRDLSPASGAPPRVAIKNDAPAAS
jgi:MFS family permease